MRAAVIDERDGNLLGNDALAGRENAIAPGKTGNGADRFGHGNEQISRTTAFSTKWGRWPCQARSGGEWCTSACIYEFVSHFSSRERQLPNPSQPDFVGPPYPLCGEGLGRLTPLRCGANSSPWLHTL